MKPIFQIKVGRTMQWIDCSFETICIVQSAYAKRFSKDNGKTWEEYLNPRY
jgi:hypothetical protein